ncbi:MAG: hypothetical protein AAGD35_15065 [Actinomycetota bacterium]
MTSQFDFSNDDWEQLTATPALVGYAVARAEDSGFLGSIRETRTLVSTIADGTDHGPARSLIEAAAAADPKETLARHGAAAPDALAHSAVMACEELVRILAATAQPDESADFRRWVLEVATTVAEAAREHGVLVSSGEAAVIDRVRTALQLG